MEASSADTPKPSKLEAGANAESGAVASSNPVSKIISALKIEEDPKRNRSLFVVALIGHLWTVSNLMVVSVLPVYMKQELQMSNASIGVLEGAAIFAAFFSKVFSGVISDVMKSRVAVIAVGAMMTFLVKPMFAASGVILTMFGRQAAFYTLFTGKIIDRLSKGVRAAPVDALIADLSSKESRNRAYSLNHSFATFGGVIGSILCSFAMYMTKNRYEVVFMLASIPAILALVLLYTGIEQPKLDDSASTSKGDGKPASSKEKKSGGAAIMEQLSEFGKLPAEFYFSAIIVATLYLARFSESFVILRARSLGIPSALLPLLLTLNQLTQSLLTFPMGVLADKLSNKMILIIGFLVLIAANAAFIFLPNTTGVILGFLLVGVHLSMTQANTKGLLSSSLSATQRGVGFAFFAILSGISLAAGNITAGVLNDFTVAKGLGMVGCFYGGATATTAATVLLLIYYSVFGNKKKTV